MYADIVGWAVDFIRALRDRPLWAKVLVRVCMGKYAYQEFVGLMKALEKEGISPYLDYDLENMSYHKDKVQRYWWKQE